MADPRQPDDSPSLEFDLDLDEIILDNLSAPPNHGAAPNAPLSTEDEHDPLAEFDEPDDLEELEETTRDEPVNAAAAATALGADPVTDDVVAPPADAVENEEEASDSYLEESVEVVFDDDEEEGYLDETEEQPEASPVSELGFDSTQEPAIEPESENEFPPASGDESASVVPELDEEIAAPLDVLPRRTALPGKTHAFHEARKPDPVSHSGFEPEAGVTSPEVLDDLELPDEPNEPGEVNGATDDPPPWEEAVTSTKEERLPELRKHEELEELDELDDLEFAEESDLEMPVPPEVTSDPESSEDELLVEPAAAEIPTKAPPPEHARTPEPTHPAASAAPAPVASPTDDLGGYDDLDGLDFEEEIPAEAAARPIPPSTPARPLESSPDDLGQPDELTDPRASKNPSDQSPAGRKLVPLEWASLAALTLLFLFGLYAFQRSVKTDPPEDARSLSLADVPARIEGTLFKFEDVQAFWRDKRDGDRVNPDSVILPEVTLTLTSGASGYVQALIKDETGEVRGDSVTQRIVGGKFEPSGNKANFLGTEGFINESFFAGYRASGDELAWTVTLRESADNSKWSEIATFRIPAVRKAP